MTSSGAEGLERAAKHLQDHERARASGDPLFRMERFDVERLIGEGAAAVVYRARDRQLGRPVALKVLREPLGAGDTTRERFQREARVAAGLAHPNVVAVHDAGEEEGRLYLVMELVDGRPMSDLMAATPRDIRALVRLLEKSARGVGAAHAQGIVHRDLKPANILVTREGEPKVGDFGLAHVAGGEVGLTRTGSVMGTPLYMSPEQALGRTGDISPRTDVHGLGAILYEILTGRTPYAGGSATEIFGRIMNDEPAEPRRLNPEAPRELEAVAMKAIEKDPDRRYGTASEFADELRRWLDGDPVLARSPGPLRRATKTLRRHRTALVVTGAVLLAAFAGVTVEGSRRRSRDHDQSLKLLEAGTAALERGDVGEALARYDDSIRLNPGSLLARRSRGEARRLSGDFQGAATDFREAIRLDPAHGAAHAGLGAALTSLGDFDGAIRAASDAIRLDPRHAVAFNIRADARRGAHDFEGAVADATEALRLNGSLFDAYANRAFALLAIGKAAASIPDFERALDLAPSGWPGRDEMIEALNEARRRSRGN